MLIPNSKQLDGTAAAEALWRIAETNEIAKLESILSIGIDVDTLNQNGTTALMRAACYGRLEMVRALLAHGADPNVARNDKFTPLTLAAFFGHVEVVRELVQFGAKIDVPTRFGTSARMWALSRTFDEVANYLKSLELEVPVSDEQSQGSGNEPLTKVETGSFVTLIGDSYEAKESAQEQSASDTAELVDSGWSLAMRNVEVLATITDRRSRFLLPPPVLKASARVSLIVAFMLIVGYTVDVKVLRRQSSIAVQGRQSTEPLSPKAQANELKSGSLLVESPKPIQPETRIQGTAETRSQGTDSDHVRKETGSQRETTSANLRERRRIDAEARLSADVSEQKSSRDEETPTTQKQQNETQGSVTQVQPKSQQPFNSSSRSTSDNKVSPLSSQLLSPSSKRESKPKVIQWP